MMQTSINFKPWADRVVVERIDHKGQEEGVYIPDTAIDRPLRARVKAFGEDVQDLNLEDVVVHEKFAGTELLVDSKMYLIMRKQDVFGTTELKDVGV